MSQVSAKMLFGLSKKQLVSWGLLATGVKIAFGFWAFSRLGWNFFGN